MWGGIMGKCGYKIKKHDGKYYFALYPCNNHNQQMGQSKEYQTLEECKMAIVTFRDFVNDNKLNKPTNGKLQIKSKNDNPINRYYFNYIEKNEVIFFRTIGYGEKKNCMNAIKRIYDKIDEYTTNNLDK